MNTSIAKHNYAPDILGAGYEQLTLNFPDDYEGKVVATLVRKKATQPTQKAVLYIHGFLDYFFQTEMAEQFNAHGYDFYALDLRKYGRSKLPHQIFYNVLDLNEYDAEITQALEIIGQEKHTQVLLAGHSTGGLTATLYAAHHPDHPLIKALWANSPFYDFNLSLVEKKFGIPMLSRVGKYLPKALYTTNFTEPLSYQGSAFLKLP
ncbi:alpha/beta hydrolase, partial [Acinetobacter baumannii]